MRYIIYCDESKAKGRFYSNFYGGALIEASRREGLEQVLNEAKRGNLGEFKWTKISESNEADYVHFVNAVFDLIRDGFLKMRIMFTQNINQTPKELRDEFEDTFFKLYYQFIKHSFGLMYCNPAARQRIDVSVYLDDAPDTAEKLAKFKRYLKSLGSQKPFREARVDFDEEEIVEIDSRKHVILQAVDVVLGAMQFRLNEHHRDIPDGKKRRGKRTKAKERVFRQISARIREIYPNFNIGTSTGHMGGETVRWNHPYRHWCFVPRASTIDRSREKKAQKRQAPQPPT